MDRLTWSIQGLNAVGIAGFLALNFGLDFILRRWTAFPLALVIAIAWLTVFLILAWRKMDETARSAHKNAWFWGGSVGLGLGLLGLLTVFRMDPHPALLMRFGRQPVFLMMEGATIAAIPAFVGYALVWTGWWLRAKR
jgi:hypothetical protein